MEQTVDGIENSLRLQHQDRRGRRLQVQGLERLTVKLLCVGSVGSDLPADVLDKSGNTPFSRFNEPFSTWDIAVVTDR
jgi:hypothetical protein